MWGSRSCRPLATCFPEMCSGHLSACPASSLPSLAPLLPVLSACLLTLFRSQIQLWSLLIGSDHTAQCVSKCTPDPERVDLNPSSAASWAVLPWLGYLTALGGHRATSWGAWHTDSVCLSSCSTMNSIGPPCEMGYKDCNLLPGRQ